MIILSVLMYNISVFCKSIAEPIVCVCEELSLEVEFLLIYKLVFPHMVTIKMAFGEFHEELMHWMFLGSSQNMSIL